MVGIKKPVNVKVLSCFGSHPICKTFFPRLASAIEILQLAVDLPIHPFPYTDNLIIIDF